MDNNEYISADIIIGCDGVNGITRKYVCGTTNIVKKQVFRGISNDKKKLSDIITPFITYEEDLRSTPQNKNVKIYENLKLLYSSISLRIRGLDGPDPFDIKKEFFRN